MNRLVREKKCPECEGKKFTDGFIPAIEKYLNDCYFCKGTGTVATPLSDDEVRELLVAVVRLNEKYNLFIWEPDCAKLLDGVKVVKW
jgi:hypothetical protein